MGLDFEYFEKQKHIKDLQKLNENKLEFIIRSLRDGIEGFKPKELIKTCNEAIDLFKDFRFILYGYMDAMRVNIFPEFCYKTSTARERLINNIDAINEELKTILETKIVKLTKNN